MAKPGAPLLLRPSLPIVAQEHVDLAASDVEQVRKRAEQIRRNNRDFDLWSGFGGNVGCGIADGPAVLFEDYSPIALYEGFGQEYRALALAGDGDAVLVSETPQPAFESYCRNVLKLGDATVMRVAARPRTERQSLAVQACDDRNVFADLCTRARDGGAMTVMPYMATGGSWLLASRIARATSVPVRVAAPPPKLARLVNDKLWFAEQVRQLLGTRAVPPTYAVYGMAAAIAHLFRLARTSRRVVIKVPESAGGMGNFALTAEEVLNEPPAMLRSRLTALLAGRGWTGSFPLAVGVWQTPVLDNPSVQLWIPAGRDGPPIVEGIFSQAITPDRGEFIGVAPAALAADQRHELVRQAVMLASLWQMLGYFGRCSFDAILCGTTQADTTIRWIECNGRWGGASVPMTLANRLTGNWARQVFRTVHLRGPLEGALSDIGALFRQLDDVLFVRDRRETGIIFVVPTRTRRGAGANLLLLAASPEEAARLADRALALSSGTNFLSRTSVR